MFQRKEAIDISAEIEAAVEGVLKRHGLRLDARGKRITYGEDLTVKFIIVKGDSMNRDARVLKEHAALYGLPADALGRKIRVGGREFTITGFNTKARTMPVLARGDDGRTYKFRTMTVLTTLVD